MRAESVVVDAPLTGHNVLPQRYLRAVVAVARSARPPEYAVVHFGSGKFFRTDRLGALMVRALIDGQSDVEAMEFVDRIEAGAGERARHLIDGLGATGALTRLQPLQADHRWRLRRLAAIALGLALSVVGPFVRLTPTAVLAWMFRILPSSPITHHVWRSGRDTILGNLRASGYADRSEQWLLDTGHGCAAFPLANGLFMYLSSAIPRERLGHLVDRLIDRDSAAEVTLSLEAAGGTVGVFLHSGLCVAVPNALRIRGQQVVRAVVPWTHGTNLSQRSGQLSEFFGDPPQMCVEVTQPLATAALVRHLKSGRSVYIALDKLAFERKTAEIDMLGHRFPRNDGPAWLAVRSGRPIALWTTHASASGFVIKASRLLYPDPSLPAELRVAALSERLYAHAEAAIREHPEAWACWSYLSLVTAKRA